MAQIIENGFKIAKDRGGFPTYLTTNFCNGYAVLLPDNTEYVLQVPTGIDLAIFQKTAGADLFISQDNNPDPTSLTIPGGTFIQTSMELNKPGVVVIAGMYLHFLSASPTYLKVNFYDSGTSQR